MSFVERKIELFFELGNDATFNPNGDNTVTISKHRIQVHISKTTGPSIGEARIRVYGMAPTLLNKLASLNQATAVSQANLITVRAGDDVNGLAIVFQGQIILAQADMSQQPTTALNITATGIGLLAIQKVPINTYPVSADAAIILQNLSVQAGLGFLNYGASKILATPYFWGTVWQQIDACARAAGFEKVIDEKTLIIWPRGQVRGGAIPLISPATGLIGYPSYVSMAETGGLSLRTVFNPQLRIGCAVKVESSLPVANGVWGVFSLQHEIESMVPGGQWMTQFTGVSYQAPPNG